MSPTRRRSDGFSLAEVMVSAGVLALALTIGLPALDAMGSRAAANAGARRLAMVFQGLRWRSVASGRGHGLMFERDGQRWRWHVVRDGNGNGLRSAEVRSGVDPTLSGPHRLEDQAQRAHLGFPPFGVVPRIPPRRGTLGALVDPIRIGNTSLLAFTPLGTSTSGTLYVTDGRHALLGIVIYGASGRVRVWRYDEERATWTM